MSRVKLALYAGPGSGLAHKASHLVTCLVLSIRSGKWCPYSHAELVIDGVCHSSSVRDGGVRSKVIDLANSHWVVVPIEGVNVEVCLRRFSEHAGRGYDWPGALRWGLPFLRERSRADYCFELVAYMLDLPRPENWSALGLLHFARDRR